MNLNVIAYAHNGHSDKFGIPRQSREESPIVTHIVFEPDYAVPEALRGIDGFSHLWLIWGFSEVQRDKEQCAKEMTESQLSIVNSQLSIPNSHWSPTVRPPRLGGNKRMGVFATRSPFRPNPIGLSSVKLLKVAYPRPLPEGKGETLELIVSGADLLDGTPIYDIKPYLSFSDSHPDALNGFAEDTANYQLSIANSQLSINDLPEEIRRDIEYILAQDPRPAYQDDPTREYKMDYAGYTVTFTVDKTTVFIKKIEKK